MYAPLVYLGDRADCCAEADQRAVMLILVISPEEHQG